MPLKYGKSQHAFESNIKTEMAHGKPMDQSLAIAYATKRKSKKAKGGQVEPMDYKKRPPYAEGGAISTANEKRSMPDDTFNDSKEASRNSSQKPSKNDNWLDQPELKQARKGLKTTPIKYPKMVPTDAFSAKLRDEEDDLQSSAFPGPYGKQPNKDLDESIPNRQGTNVPDMEDEHSTHRKPYAAGGGVDEIIPDAGFGKIIIMKNRQGMADGGEALKEEERHLMSSMSPSEDEGYMYADEHNESMPNRQGTNVLDMEDEHTTGRKPYAMGGTIQYRDSMGNMDEDMELNPAHDKHSEDDSEDQPTDEEQLEHHNSMIAAIMAKRKMARGGEILEDSPDIHSHGSMDSDDSGQVDLNRNADEDANEEDQTSFNALRKENYSESDALRATDHPEDSNMDSDNEEMDSHDSHDMISQIRSKMRRRQFKG